MRRHRMLPRLLVTGCVAALAFAGEVMVPEVTELADTSGVLLTFDGGGEGRPAFVARSIGDETQRATRPVPSAGLDRFKLALIAKTGEDLAITGFSVVTWKSAEKAGSDEWPEISNVAGSTARIRGAGTLVLRRRQTVEKDAKWSFEIVSFRTIDPKKDDDERITKAKKEVIEEGGARLVEDERFTLAPPESPSADTRYGVVLVPVWKESGRILDGFDAQLVRAPSPARKDG
jgi:hypothetical protein